MWGGVLPFLVVGGDDFVFYLHDGEVEFYFCLGGFSGEIGSDHIAENMSGFLEECLLLWPAIGYVLEGLHGACELAHLCEGVNDGESGLDGTWMVASM